MLVSPKQNCIGHLGGTSRKFVSLAPKYETADLNDSIDYHFFEIELHHQVATFFQDHQIRQPSDTTHC